MAQKRPWKRPNREAEGAAEAEDAWEAESGQGGPRGRAPMEADMEVSGGNYIPVIRAENVKGS